MIRVSSIQYAHMKTQHRTPLKISIWWIMHIFKYFWFSWRLVFFVFLFLWSSGWFSSNMLSTLFFQYSESQSKSYRGLCENLWSLKCIRRRCNRTIQSQPIETETNVDKWNEPPPDYQSALHLPVCTFNDVASSSFMSPNKVHSH